MKRKPKIMENTQETKFELNAAVLDSLLKGVTDGSQLFGTEGLLQQLKQALMQRMLEAEMSSHLGFEKGEKSADGRENYRNGAYERTVNTESGPVTVKMPRDRNGSFTPKLLPKHRRRLEGFDEKVLGLYARGVSQRDIQSALSDFYGAEVSQELISEVTDGILDEAKAWQHRPLEAVYPVVYLDALFVFVKHEGVVQKRAAYLAIGINVDGRREPLGLWLESHEGSKFWLSVLTDLKNRGVQDIFFVCCDGLTGFPQAIEAAFPNTVVQTCIVHLLRNSLRYVSESDKKSVSKALKTVYSADNEAQAEKALTDFETQWPKYASVSKMWRTRWKEIVPFLAYLKEVRKILYTTNTIESVNSQLRKVLRPKGHFPSDDAVIKLIYLALQRAQVKWRASIHWKQAMAHFAVMFDGRLPS